MTLGQDQQTYYLKTSSQREWHEAEGFCQQYGMDGLAPVNTQAMVENLNQLSIDGDVWIDVTNPDDVNCDSKETCNLQLENKAGDPITTDLSYFTNEFRLNQDQNGDRECIKRKDNGRWDDEECDDDKSMLCYQVCAPALQCDGDVVPTLANSNNDNQWSSSNKADIGDSFT